jgi:NADH-ubiquinone oxidoreductase chain 6
MSDLLIITDNLTNGYKEEILNIISLLSILSGVLVITSKNPIVSVLFLIGLFLSISSYLIILGLSFIGLSYLLVYIGAVSILFIFILMLINVRVSELLSNTSNSIPLAILTTICFNYPIYQILPFSITTFNNLITNLNNLLYDMWYNNYLDYLYKPIKLDSISLYKISFVSSNT